MNKKWLKRNWLALVFAAFALFFAVVAAANRSGGYSPYENQTVAFLSSVAGAYVAYGLILVLPTFIISRTLLRKNTWPRWLIALPILLFLLALSMMNVAYQ